MTDKPQIDLLDRHTFAYALIALIVLGGLYLAAHYLRRALHARRRHRRRRRR